MTTQLQLFPAPPPAQRHSAASLDAADAIAPTAATLRQRVLDYLVARGERGATDEEMQIALNMPGSTQRPRRIELHQYGKIALTNETRKTGSGRAAHVWVAL